MYARLIGALLPKLHFPESLILVLLAVDEVYIGIIITLLIITSNIYSSYFNLV